MAKGKRRQQPQANAPAPAPVPAPASAPALAAPAVPVRMIGLTALTFIHPGIGQTVGAIDLPVSREAATGYPYIAGTSFKGALRDVARRHWETDPQDADKPSAREKAVFGSTDESAGSLIVSDIRLLLLPVRSLEGAFRYVTCPQLIARFATDLRRAGFKPGFTGAEFKNGHAQLVDRQAAVETGQGHLFLEELVYTRSDSFSATIGAVAQEITKLLPGGLAQTLDLPRRLTVLTDDQFAWFARSALPVRMRNALDPEKKTIKPGHLWSEEYIAPDTVMYSLLARRGDGADPEPLGEVEKLLDADGNFVQVGGNETVGQGWFEAAWLAAKTGTAT